VLKDAKLKPSEIDDIVLVGGSTRIPKMQAMLQEYFGGKELCRSLNPDEAVAYGAAVQGAILNGSRDKSTANLLLMDVTPLSLGIETTGRLMSVVVPRNSPIPCVKTQTYTTEADFQTEIDVCVYEGERAKTTENNLLGKFTISGIERAKRGVPKIDVSFALDSNGILNVSARDQTTGAEAQTQIERSGRSSEADIERMVKDAAKFRAEDDEALKRVEAINELESMINELKTISMDSKSADKARVLDQAADDAQAWADENAEQCKVSEIKLKRKGLETTLFKYNKINNKQ
jgi:heat shock 70kDa protein 1/2/6/8